MLLTGGTDRALLRRARFNRVRTNPLFRPVSMVHTPDGRRGAAGVGAGSRLVNNLQVAGGGRVKLRGKTFVVTNPRIVPTAGAVGLLKPPWRQLLGHAGVAYPLPLCRAG